MNFKIKVNPIWTSDVMKEAELQNIWKRYHEKDIPETNFTWQSWSQKEPSQEEEANK